MRSGLGKVALTQKKNHSTSGNKYLCTKDSVSRSKIRGRSGANTRVSAYLSPLVHIYYISFQQCSSGHKDWDDTFFLSERARNDWKKLKKFEWVEGVLRSGNPLEEMKLRQK